MKALVYIQPNEIQLLEVPDPVLSSEEVILKIDAVGICGSDMHAYHGHDPRRKPGLILGHEFSGTIIESKNENFAPGDRVTGNPLITCGICEYCIQGRDNLCENRSMVGMTRPGAFAEFMSTHGKSLIKISNKLSSVNAALTEPAATAYHALRISEKYFSDKLTDQKILIIGAGAIGFLTALLLKHKKCNQFTIAETSSLRLESVKANIGCEVVNPITNQIAENSFTLIVDAVGSKQTRDLAFHSIRPGGVIMHIGLQDFSSEIDMRKLTLAEITLLGTYTYTMKDLQSTVILLENEAFGDLNWIEKRDLAQGSKAFSDLDQGKVRSSKIILMNQ